VTRSSAQLRLLTIFEDACVLPVASVSGVKNALRRGVTRGVLGEGRPRGDRDRVSCSDAASPATRDSADTPAAGRRGHGNRRVGAGYGRHG
jgi:hypothetical protein